MIDGALLLFLLLCWEKEWKWKRAKAFKKTLWAWTTYNQLYHISIFQMTNWLNDGVCVSVTCVVTGCALSSASQFSPQKNKINKTHRHPPHFTSCLFLESEHMSESNTQPIPAFYTHRSPACKDKTLAVCTRPDVTSTKLCTGINGSAGRHCSLGVGVQIYLCVLEKQRETISFWFCKRGKAGQTESVESTYYMHTLNLTT